MKQQVQHMKAFQLKDALSLNLSLIRDTVVLGEPIILRYDIMVGGDGEGLWVYLGQEQSAWAGLSLVDEARQPAPERPDPRKPQGGLQPTTEVRVAPGQTYRASLVVTQWLTVPHVGRYELHIKARLPYVLGERAEGFPPRLWHQTTKTVFVQKQSFTITVTEPEEDRLRQIAEGLRHDAMTRPDHDQRIAALRALVAMPERYALASWETLANERGFRDKEDLMRELAHVMTPAAADLLAQMWNPGYGPHADYLPMPPCCWTTCTGQAMKRLKRHIEGVHGEDMGKKCANLQLMAHRRRNGARFLLPIRPRFG